LVSVVQSDDYSGLFSTYCRSVLPLISFAFNLIKENGRLPYCSFQREDPIIDYDERAAALTVDACITLLVYNSKFKMT